ncbi:MAG: reductive dehalogenase [Dehalogenimonas sp.]
MSIFHPTISRRDFMKGLGLVGAGVGVSAAVSPAFHDIDEIVSSPTAITRKPWWVKLVDEPTVQIDWGLLTSGRTQAAAPKNIRTAEELRQVFIGYYKEKWPNWNPPPNASNNLGDVRDEALLQGANFLGSGAFPSEVVTATGNKYKNIEDRWEGWRISQTPDQRGFAKWNGTPEDNLQMCKVAARFYGADDVGAIPVDDKFLKLMWGKTRRNQVFRFGDVEDFVLKPALNPTDVTFPNKTKWFLHWTMRQTGLDVLPYTAGTSQGACQTYSYSVWKKFSKHMQEFLWALGYISFANNGGIFIPTGSTGVLSGVGELSRWGSVVTPRYGNLNRGMFGFITDLPLAETKPIDAGMFRFCETCGICAEECPTGAISSGPPTWEPDLVSQNPGYLAWRNDVTKCNHCPVCQQICPFNSLDKSFVHNLVRATAATTTAFNGFFSKMERSFGYGQKDPSLWWSRTDNIPYGYDTAYGVADYS